MAKNQLVFRNAAFLGPAGSAGSAGTPGATGATGPTGATGATGPAGVVVLSVPVSDSASLSNVTALTYFSHSYTIPGGTLTVGKIIRIKWSGEFTIGASQLVAFKTNVGPLGVTSPSPTLGTTTGTFQFVIDAVLVCRTAGAGGTAALCQEVTIGNTTQNIGFGFAGEVVGSIDTTTGQTIGLQFTATAANNTSLTRMFTVISDN